MTQSHDGMILLKKPEGITSFQALGILKKKLKTKKVGHTGTLDKFASGLLVILTGKMTKFAPYITGMDKNYIATFKFGVTTDTLDPEGEITGHKPLPDLESIEIAIKQNFIGEILQTPPDFSAVHVDGKRAYQLKLVGKEVKIPPRKIHIKKFDILSWDGENLKVDIFCSKGTYIRSIARDLGHLTGSLAYVTQLERTQVGPFNISESISGELFENKNLVNPYYLISGLGRQISFVTEEAKNNILNGKPIIDEYYINNSERFNNGEVALFTENKEFVAMVEIKNNRSRYLFVSSR